MGGFSEDGSIEDAKHDSCIYTGLFYGSGLA